MTSQVISSRPTSLAARQPCSPSTIWYSPAETSPAVTVTHHHRLRHPPQVANLLDQLGELLLGHAVRVVVVRLQVLGAQRGGAHPFLGPFPYVLHSRVLHSRTPKHLAFVVIRPFGELPLDLFGHIFCASIDPEHHSRHGCAQWPKVHLGVLAVLPELPGQPGGWVGEELLDGLRLREEVFALIRPSGLSGLLLNRQVR